MHLLTFESIWPRSVHSRICLAFIGECWTVSNNKIVVPGVGILPINSVRGNWLRASALERQCPSLYLDLYSYAPRIKVHLMILADASIGTGLPSPKIC